MSSFVKENGTVMVYNSFRRLCSDVLIGKLSHWPLAYKVYFDGNSSTFLLIKFSIIFIFLRKKAIYSGAEQS